ncbi:MAG: threonylcarbamoyl-AMP synthase [Gammaproteobacteria bacterium]|nr:MAG: threonylcarbamoyl-AMP synthase [Gammaproteobacteria bacterium]
MPNLSALSPRILSSVREIVTNDGVICYPTEGVWGLGCHPQSKKAVNRIVTLKQRSLDKGVILIAASYEQITPYADITSTTKVQLHKLWPGFVTCLLPKSSTCPNYLTGQFDQIAIRLTANRIVRQLCLSAGTALVSTSANISGKPPVDNIQTAKALFKRDVDYYVDAPLGGKSQPSRIIRLTDQPTDQNMEIIRD